MQDKNNIYDHQNSFRGFRYSHAVFRIIWLFDWCLIRNVSTDGNVL